MHTGYLQALNVTIATKPSGKIKKASCVRYALVAVTYKYSESKVKCIEMLEELDDSALDTTSLQISETLKEHPKDLKIIHFSNQSMVSSFYEFQVLVSQLPMDIIAMSETWLRNNPALLDLRYTACLHSSLWKLRRYSRWRRGGFHLRL